MIAHMYVPMRSDLFRCSLIWIERLFPLQYRRLLWYLLVGVVLQLRCAFVRERLALERI